MALIYYLKNANLNFGDKVILNCIELYVHEGDKICLIGRNGSGKSSLLRVICQEYELDSGEIFKDPKAISGYLKQDVKTNHDITIYDYILQQFEEKEANKYQADIILGKLEIKGDMLLSSCSGGQLRRADLARILVLEPEILLLDEPTNHLDIKTIEWLEEYVKSYKGAIICISHDREFLSNVTNKIWWLDRGILRKSDKGFKYFDEWQELILSQEEATFSKLNKKLDQENHWLSAGVTARRKRNQKRLGDLINLRQTIRTHSHKLNSTKQKLEIELSKEVSKTNFIIEAENASFAYQTKPIINNFSFKVKKGEKIGIIGANGTGKSTFLSLLTKKIEPTSGKIKYGKNLEISEIDQYRGLLNPNDTLQLTLCPAGGDQIFLNDSSMHVAGYLKKFMFDPKLLSARVSTLSGGEANRLLLAKILINPGNLLILDEPTNDLDMDTLELLLEVLAEYAGTLIVVSHDRNFLNRLVTRTLVFEAGKIIDVVGGYDDYQRIAKPASAPSAVAKSSKPYNEVTVRAVNTPLKKLSYKHQRLLETLPSEIDKLEAEVKEIENKLSDSNLYLSNPEKFNHYSKKLKELKDKIDELTIQWLEIDQMI